MPITKSSYVERILIVLNEDGTVKGAHQNSLNTIHEDGAILRQIQGDAVAMDAATLAAVLPDQAALLAQVQALMAERDALQATVDGHAAEVAALQAQIDAHQPQPPPDYVDGVPQSVSAYQARAALLAAGLLSQVEAAVAAAPDEIVRIAWEYATVVRRQSPFIAAIGPALGLDAAAIDTLFVAAAAID